MTTAVAVIGVAATAAAVSYEHAGDLVRAHGETGWTARLIPLTVDGSTDDGLIYASLLVMLDSARRGARAPALARWLLGLGHVLIGAAVGTWPAVALVGSHELLMMVIRGAQAPTRPHGGTPMIDPLGEQAPQWCSRQTWQLMVFPQCVPSVRRSTLASCVRSGCASTLP